MANGDDVGGGGCNHSRQLSRGSGNDLKSKLHQARSKFRRSRTTNIITTTTTAPSTPDTRKSSASTTGSSQFTDDSTGRSGTKSERKPAEREEQLQPRARWQSASTANITEKDAEQGHRGEERGSIRFDIAESNGRRGSGLERAESTASGQLPDAVRRQSLIPHNQQVSWINALLDSDSSSSAAARLAPPQRNPTSASAPETAGDTSPWSPHGSRMVSRKIWVKRPGSSPTMVSLREDDLVDDVRDLVLRKYANSLGRSFDSPDVSIRLLPRDHGSRGPREGERILAPDEPVGRLLDTFYPGGQTAEEALVIDVPQRRTPRPSPRALPTQHMHYYTDDVRGGEAGDYFPPMPAVTSPHLPSSAVSGNNVSQGSHHAPVHSISVLNTGQVPPLPSPGNNRPRHHNRPRVGRTHTSSPTIISTTPGALGPESLQAPPQPPPLPTPPAPESTTHQRVDTPPPVRVSSPRLNKVSRKPKNVPERPIHQPTNGMLDGGVPPINVLIVEDNIINLKLLEAFMKRLKVRWQTAMNGRDAVKKWRTGGFHLVLMDIQLPVMNGLEATKEIRKLERVNSIGVFSSSPTSISNSSLPLTNGERNGEPAQEDKVEYVGMFKSPVIIVALTASSLQSDRHEALAAGCNDFLTKPVNFVWLERKVMEWGCMQALIDFDGWRAWKDFRQTNADDSSKGKNPDTKIALEPSSTASTPTTSSAAPVAPVPASTTTNGATNGASPSRRTGVRSRTGSSSGILQAAASANDSEGQSDPGSSSSGMKNGKPITAGA